MPNARRNRARAWCFTVNNYDREVEEALQQLANDANTSYLVYGREVGAENQTPHLQGYIEFSTKKSFSRVRGALPEGAHIERRRGTAAEAATYCKKDGDFFEEGRISRPGRRSDLEVIRQEIKEGADDLTIADNHFSQWCQYRRAFSQYRNLLQSERPKVAPFIHVIWGPSGVGKSKYVRHMHPDERIYNWGGDRWFDGYDGQPVALFDDFDGTGLEFRMLLRVLDRYKLRVPVKGGFVDWNPRRIYITSNNDPMFWYAGEDCAPLLRRLTIVDHVRSDIFQD
jgi:hypothetical protein